MLECLVYVGKHQPNSLRQTETPKAEEEISLTKIQMSKETIWEFKMVLEGWVIVQRGRK